MFYANKLTNLVAFKFFLSVYYLTLASPYPLETRVPAVHPTQKSSICLQTRDLFSKQYLNRPFYKLPTLL